MSSIKERPEYSDYYEGWKEFLNMLSITGGNQCILYGTDQKKSDALRKLLEEKKIECSYKIPYEKTNGSIPRIITFELNGNRIKILFIRHPSSRFSWDKWHKIINDEIDLSVLANVKKHITN